VLNHGNLKNKTSVKLAQALALKFIKRPDAETRCLSLTMYVEFTLKMLNVKYFEVFKDLIEQESKLKFDSKVVNKYVLLMRRIA
jgi:hypothetical protein